MEKEFACIKNHGTDPIDLRHLGPGIEMLPTELHFKEDGSIEDEMSLIMVMTHPVMLTVYGQLSLKMLNDGLSEIGYEIVKKA